MAGGVVVFISGYALQKNSLTLFKLTDNKENRPLAAIALDTQKSKFAYILFLGIALGLPTSILFNLFPDVLSQKIGFLFNDMGGKMFVVYILIFSALISLPASSLVNKIGAEKSFWSSFIAILICTVCIFLCQSSVTMVFMVVGFALTFTLLSVSSLPLAISRSNYYEKVFCVGIFFSGVALPEGIINAIQAF